jgi:hypothetical protein
LARGQDQGPLGVQQLVLGPVLLQAQKRLVWLGRWP